MLSSWELISMKVVYQPPVEIALRTLGEEDRRKVQAWLDHLKNWENDEYVRKRSDKLASFDDVYVLRTSTDFLIFFTLQRDQIVVNDIATKETVLSFGKV
jgi:mRNA-degrading endonuclease RelE of RelBE toxin-antitoxin system